MRLIPPIFATLLTLTVHAVAADFVVAPQENALEKARDAARATPGPHRIILRGGTYFLSRPLELDARDNGLTIEASPRENVTISGGRRVTNWKPWRGKIWQADLSKLDLPDYDFRELYLRGARQSWARVPNFDPKNPRRGSFLSNAGMAEADTKTKFQYRAGELDPAKWTHTQRAMMVFHDSVNYEQTWANIKSIDLPNRTLEADKGVYKLAPGCPFYVCGLLEELDAPGEWYADAESKTLYFYPPGGDPNRAEVSVPALESLFVVRGSENAPAQNITLRGVALRDCRGNAVLMQNARGNAVLSCDIANVGVGVYIGDNTRSCRVVGCDITQTQGDGVSIIGTSLDHERVSDHVVDNNYIYDFGWGYIHNRCGGVYMHRCARVKVTHNRVHDGPRYAIGMDVGNDCEIAYNYGHDMNQTTSDTGIIEAATALDWGMSIEKQAERDQLFNKGNRIHHNLLHDAGGWGPGNDGVFAFPHFSWGIYLDLHCSNWRVDNNVVWNTVLGGFMLNCGQNNVVENNVFADGKENQIQFNPWPEYVISGNRCERNIFAYDSPASLYTLNGFKPEFVTFANNFVFVRGADGPRLQGVSGFKQKGAWAQWQATGQDKGSQIGDSLFMNAARRDYRLQPNSPALKLGIAPIDITNAGLYKSAERPQVRPETKVVREVGDYKPKEEQRPRQAARRDYEDYALGESERHANVGTGGGKSSVAVTEETAAGGRRSLKITDAAGQKAAYEPYVTYLLEQDEGALHAGFDLRWERGALLVYEWRDDPYQYNLGPNLSTDAEGNLSANGKRLLQLPPGQWVRIDVDCALGKAATGHYDLSVRLPGAAPRAFKALACAPKFATLNCVVVMSMTDGPSVFYLDNVEFVPKKRR